MAVLAFWVAKTLVSEINTESEKKMILSREIAIYGLASVAMALSAFRHLRQPYHRLLPPGWAAAACL